MKLIVNKNPNILIDILQKLFDYIIIYFSNRNYLYNKKTSESMDQLKKNLIFSIEFFNKNEKNKSDKYADSTDLDITLTNFDIFSDLTESIFSSIIELGEILELKTLQTETFLIKYKIDYGGVYKEAKNNFVFALSYSIFQFYKIFKDKIYLEESDRKYLTYLNLIGKYIKICENFRGNFSTLENFKFYEESDLNIIRNNSDKKNSSEKLNFSIKNSEDDNIGSNKDLNSNPIDEFNFEVINLKNLLKSSFYDANENIVKNLTQINLLDEIFDLGLFEENADNIPEIYTQIFDDLNLTSTICISNSFDIFLKNFVKLTKKILDETILSSSQDPQEDTENNPFICNQISKLEKIFFLFYNIYSLYYKEKEQDKDFTDILILHNNIKAFIFVFNFYIKIDLHPNLLKKYNHSSHAENKNLENSQIKFLNLLNFFENFKNKFEDFGELIMSKIFTNFLQNLNEEFSSAENFEELRYDRKYKKADKMFKNCNDYIEKFFDFFKLFANEKDFFSNLNYTLCLFFDVLNKKILSIKDFSVEDLVATSNFLKNNSNDLKKKLEKIIDQNLNTGFKLKYAKIMDMNKKYKKFEEIIFILNSGLRDIKNLIVNSASKLNIDANELISLIEAIFEKSDFRDEVKDLILQYIRKGN